MEASGSKAQTHRQTNIHFLCSMPDSIMRTLNIYVRNVNLITYKEITP